MTDSSDLRAGQVVAVVAATPGGVIGDGEKMPWHIRSDLRRFKRMTMGGVLIMGRKTFDSIGRVLPGRQTVVLTRNRNWSHPEVISVGSVQDALAVTTDRTRFVVGGGQIYEAMWDACDEIWWTCVFARLNAQTRICLPSADFKPTTCLPMPMAPGDDYPTRWMRLVRRCAKTL
ncbi:MAG: dihydrofolate reductase [Planctomycetota bacterium]